MAPGESAPRSDADLQKEYADLIRPLTQPIPEEKLRIILKNRDGTETSKEVVLGDQMADFAQLVDREEDKLRGLLTRQERVAGEIVALAVEILGQREARSVLAGVGLVETSPAVAKKGKGKTVGFSDSEGGVLQTDVDVLGAEVEVMKKKIEGIGAEAVELMEKEMEVAKKERKEKNRKLAELVRND